MAFHQAWGWCCWGLALSWCDSRESRWLEPAQMLLPAPLEGFFGEPGGERLLLTTLYWLFPSGRSTGLC